MRTMWRHLRSFDRRNPWVLVSSTMGLIYLALVIPILLTMH